MRFQFSILFVSAHPRLLRFKQSCSEEALQFLPEESPFFRGVFNFFFSNKRPIDKLKLRIS